MEALLLGDLEGDTVLGFRSIASGSSIMPTIGCSPRLLVLPFEVGLAPEGDDAMPSFSFVDDLDEGTAPRPADAAKLIVSHR